MFIHIHHYLASRSFEISLNFRNSDSSKVKIHPFVQAALVGVIKAVLSMYLLQVFPQHGLMSEHHIAVVASMRLVSAVQVQMIEQRALLRKRLSAYFTLKRFDPRVDPHVPVQVALLRECLATE